MKKLNQVLSRSVLSLGFICGLSGCGSGMQTAAPNPTTVNGMYTRYFGDASRPPILFIHDSYGDASVSNETLPAGGPSVNSMYFEYGMAEQLAEKGNGFFVVVYDQRGQGRSDEAKSKDYTYKQYSDDINALINVYHLQNDQHTINLTIVGHSHGGVIALKFDEMNPGIAKQIILLDTPLDVFQTLNNIETNCQTRYTSSKETNKIDVMKSSITTLSTKSTSQKDRAVIATQLFSEAANCGGQTGLYTAPAQPLVAASSDPSLTADDPREIDFQAKYAASNAYQNSLKFYQMVAWLHTPIIPSNQTLPLTAFQANEDFLHVNETAYVTAHNDHIFGIYGSQDGLFDTDSLAKIKTSLGADVTANAGRMVMIDGASHNVFIDRSDLFLAAIYPMLPTFIINP